MGLVASSLAVVERTGYAPQPHRESCAKCPPSNPVRCRGLHRAGRDVNGTLFQFGPVFTLFITTQLTRTPTAADQQSLTDLLAAIEQSYAFGPSGVFSYIGYGLPYFDRLPGGVAGDLVGQHMPRLLLNRRRYALEEAVPAPTDVAAQSPDVSKQTFNLPVAIENNDLLLTFQSDVRENLTDILAWLLGANELTEPACSRRRSQI